MNRTIIVLTVIVSTIVSSAQAQSIVGDGSNEAPPPISAGPGSPEIGAGNMIARRLNAAYYGSPARDGSLHPDGEADLVNGNNDQIPAGNAGYDRGTLSLDLISSTGFGQFEFLYSADGVNFTLISSFSLFANATPIIALNTTTHDIPRGANLNSDTLASDTFVNQVTFYLRFKDDSATPEW